MPDPYCILGLAPGADDTAIRERYLQLVQRHPPEREPVRAAEIRQAYDSLRDPVARLRHDLFSVRPDDTLESLVQEYSSHSFDRRIPTATLLLLGRS